MVCCEGLVRALKKIRSIKVNHMRLVFRLSLAVPCIAALLAAPGTVRAASISGVAYCGISSAVAGSTPTSATLSAGEATGKECATFSATSITFSAETSAGYSLGGFLTGDGAAYSISYLNGYTAGSGLNNTLFVFTGTASFTNGSSFDVTHDDGTNMYVNGSLVLGVPGPTPPITTPYTYTGATGNYGFQFIYTEWCGGAADYITTLVPPTSPVPEPNTLMLVASGVLGLGGLVRRRMGL
jgi:hypothetical protein